MHFNIKNRVPYNKLLTNLACSSRTGEYWPSVIFVRTSLRSVRTVTTSGQYSLVRPSRSVSKRLIFLLLLSSQETPCCFTQFSRIHLRDVSRSQHLNIPFLRILKAVLYTVLTTTVFVNGNTIIAMNATCNQPTCRIYNCIKKNQDLYRCAMGYVFRKVYFSCYQRT